MPFITREGGEIYELNPDPKLPEWLDIKKKKKLEKKHEKSHKGVEFIQDFNMPDSATSLLMTKDENYIYATGTYKPRVKCFDVNGLSMKFERCLDSDVIKFAMLSKSYETLAFLQNDRYVEFHSRQGRLHRLRIPYFGRDLTYMNATSDLYFVGISSDISRINLREARFMTPLKAESKQINCCSINDHHHMLTTGSSEGLIECWDPRAPKKITKTHVALHSSSDLQISSNAGVTCMSHFDFYHLGVGTSTGEVLIYDLRNDKPLISRQQGSKKPIVSVAYKQRSSGGSIVLSADEFYAKMWYKDSGEIFGQISSLKKINDVLLIPDTGLVCVASANSKISSYYSPDLGRPPKWCAALSTLTKEMEGACAEDEEIFKFVTIEELQELRLSHLIGTNLLRAEMHGFMMRAELYNKATSMAANQKVSSKAPEVIKKVDPKLKANHTLADNLRLVGAEDKAKGFDKLLEDDRFSELFKDNKFKVDTKSDHYQRILSAKPKKAGSPVSDEEVEPDAIDSDDDLGLKPTKKVKVQNGSEGHENKKTKMRKKVIKARLSASAKDVKIQQIAAGTVMNPGAMDNQLKLSKTSFGERLNGERTQFVQQSAGNMEAKFVTKRVGMKRK